MRKQLSALVRSWSIGLTAVVSMLLQAYAMTDLGAAQRAKKQGGEEARKVEARRVDLVELRSLDQLKEAFESDRGKVRLLTLLSPT